MVQNCPESTRPKLRGFTLVEVMVSIAILSAILVLFAAIISSAQDGLSLVNSSTKQRQDARVILANIAEELKQSIQSPALNYEEGDSANRQFQLLINPDTMGTLANAHTMFWSTSGGSQNTSGLVGYAVRWDQSDPQNVRPLFCRMYVPANEGQSLLATLKDSASATWASAGLMDAYAPGNAANGYQGWLADNILAFYARALDPQNQPVTRQPREITGVTLPDKPYYIGMSGITLSGDESSLGADYGNRFDSSTGYQYTHESSNGDVQINRFGPALPAAVEIVLVTASPEAIGRLTSVPTQVPGISPDNMWGDIDTFISGLPESLQKDVHTYSVIVSLSQWP